MSGDTEEGIPPETPLSEETNIELKDGQSLQVSIDTETTPGQLEFAEIEAGEGRKVNLRDILEGLLFAANAPISIKQFQKVLKDSLAMSHAEIQKVLESLKGDLDQGKRCYELVEVFGGYQFQTRTIYSPWIRKIRTVQKNERLSKSALETLAIVAYKQPLTRAEIEEIRGVNVDGVMRHLLDKGLVYPSGKKDIPGKPTLYSTSKSFLSQFGLKSIQELPPLTEMHFNN